MKPTFYIVCALSVLATGGARADDVKPKTSKASVEAKSTSDKTTGGKAKAASAKPGDSKKAVAPVKKERVIDFTKEEEIRGVLTKPEAELVGARRRVHSKSLLPIRLHFIPEMMKTASDL